MKERILKNIDGGMKSSNDGKWAPKDMTAYDIYSPYSHLYEFNHDPLKIACDIDDLYAGDLDLFERAVSLPSLLRFYKRLQQPILDGKYPAYNFCKMSSQESLDQIYESARRHFKQYLDGDTSEDHYSAVLANMCFMHIIHSNIKNNTDFYEI